MNTSIAAIGTATPANKYTQHEIAEYMVNALDLDPARARRLHALYRATGISTRHSVLADYRAMPANDTFFNQTNGTLTLPGTASRMLRYRKEALGLSLQAVAQCLGQDLSTTPNNITHLITVSCTGMYAPGLDIELIERLGLSPNTERTCINFMGCYAAFPALKAAHAICKANPQARVLVLCIEMCSLHFQNKTDDDNLLANAIFADGAAAVIVRNTQPHEPALVMNRFFCGLLPKGKQDMAWAIGNLGFEMRLSAYVPDIIRTGISSLINQLLSSHGSDLKAVNHYAIHPGGKKILQAIEAELGLTRHDNRFAYQVLSQYGNMSSPTVLFVLKALWQAATPGNNGQQALSLAFGPGLTLESALFTITGQ